MGTFIPVISWAVCLGQYVNSNLVSEKEEGVVALGWSWYRDANQVTTSPLTDDWKEGSVLFNDALNTFYLWLYGIGHMVIDHSHSER